MNEQRNFAVCVVRNGDILFEHESIEILLFSNGRHANLKATTFETLAAPIEFSEKICDCFRKQPFSTQLFTRKRDSKNSKQKPAYMRLRVLRKLEQKKNIVEITIPANVVYRLS